MSHIKNAVIFGISADTVASHKAFAEKQRLNFPILADPNKKVIAAYGVLNSSGMANRVTFVIGPRGRIRQIDSSVNAEFARQGSGLISHHGEELELMLSKRKIKLGSLVPKLSINDTDGNAISILLPGAQAIALVFLPPGKPDNHILSALQSLATNPSLKRVGFIGILPLSQAMAKRQSGEDNLHFPIGYDPEGAIFRRFGVHVVPSVWVVDAASKAVYAGSILGKMIGQDYLKQALTKLLSGRKVTPDYIRPVGATVQFPAR